MAAQALDPTVLSFAFWVRKLGPFLDGDGVLNLAALSVDELLICEEFGDVLVLATGIEKVYPSFQFGSSGERLPGLREVIATLKPDTQDAWDIALWLTTVSRRFDGRSAVDLMREGRCDVVISAAKRDAAGWREANELKSVPAEEGETAPGPGGAK